jgi:hypothetical protein
VPRAQLRPARVNAARPVGPLADWVNTRSSRRRRPGRRSVRCGQSYCNEGYEKQTAGGRRIHQSTSKACPLGIGRRPRRRPCWMHAKSPHCGEAAWRLAVWMNKGQPLYGVERNGTNLASSVAMLSPWVVSRQVPALPTALRAGRHFASVSRQVCAPKPPPDCADELAEPELGPPSEAALTPRPRWRAYQQDSSLPPSTLDSGSATTRPSEDDPVTRSA